MLRNTLLVLSGLALLSSGCGDSGPPPKWVIAVIPKGLTHQHWESVRRGAEKAAADFTEEGIRVRVLWEGPNTEGNINEQISLVNQMAGRANGIVLAPQSSTGLKVCVKEADEKGVPTVIIDSDLADKSLYLKYVATDNYNGGQMAAKHLLDVLRKEGKKAPKLVLFRYQVASESTDQREKGFLDHVNAEIARLKKAGEPAPEIISDDVYAGDTVDSAQKKAGPLLIDVGERADGIFAVNESATTGMLNEINSKPEKYGHIKLMGFDTSKELIQALKDGKVVGLIAQDPYRMGYLGVHAVVRHLEGDDVSQKKYLPTGEFLITKDNVSSVETRERIEPELQAKRTITAPKYPSRK
jgi:ribose transport system substrate-binding protein